MPDHVWLAFVPPEFRNLLVCLYCVDEQAAIKGISYASQPSEVYFSARAATIAFAIDDAVD